MASRARPPRHQVSPAQFLALLMAFLLLCLAGGVVGAGMATPLALGTNATTNDAVKLFDELPNDLTPSRPSEASNIYFSNGQFMATIYEQNRVIKPLSEISPIMQQAVIDIEDKRFRQHGAVDFKGIARAAMKQLKGNHEGASTLTQQYVKNVLIDQAIRTDDPIALYEATETTLARKAKEAKLAINLEENMSKDQILEGYLNIAQFGASVYGVEAAAQQYFSKSAKDLNYLEAATIAGITREPSKYDPSNAAHLADATRRRNTVLGVMYDEGHITLEERDAGIATPIESTLAIQKPKVGCEAAGNAAFFCDYVFKYILANPAFGKTQDERRNRLYRDGLNITTSLDQAMQGSAYQNAVEAVPPDERANGTDRDGEPIQYEDAVVSVEPGTGFIRAMAQNRPYSASAGKPGSDAPPRATSVNYSADQAHGGSAGFSPGSTWKPFTLAEWLSEGHTLGETVNANQRALTRKDFRPGGCLSGFGDPWKPGNSDGQDDKGTISVLQATYNSVNTAYASIETALDMCGLRQTAWNIGFRPSITNEVKSGDSSSIQVNASMTIGTQNSSPLSMAAAFGTFASSGTYCEPQPIMSVETNAGEKIDVPTTCNKDALAPHIANTVTYALQQVLTKGSAKTLGPTLVDGRIAAGKTGTANGSTHTWFVGYTPQLSTAVWIGNSENNNSALVNRTIAGKFHRGYIYGSTIAAPTWQSYMNEALAGAPVMQFPDPDPALVDGGSSTPQDHPAGGPQGTVPNKDNG